MEVQDYLLALVAEYLRLLGREGECDVVILTGSILQPHVKV